MSKRMLLTINLFGILFVLSGFMDKVFATTIRIPARQASPGGIVVIPILADTATGTRYLYLLDQSRWQKCLQRYHHTNALTC